MEGMAVYGNQHASINNNAPMTNDFNFQNFKTEDYISFISKCKCPVLKCEHKSAKVSFAMCLAVCINVNADEGIPNVFIKPVWDVCDFDRNFKIN